MFVSSGGSLDGTGGGFSFSFNACVCLGGGLIAGFGGSAGFGLLSVATSGVPNGVLVDWGGESGRDCDVLNEEF